MKLIKLTLPIISFFIVTGSLHAQDKEVQEFKIEGLSCKMCSNAAKSALADIAGVESAAVDFETKKAVVYSSGGVSRNDIEEAISSTSFEAVFVGEKLPKPLTEEQKENLDIETIKGGEELSFTEHLSEGKITIFDFYADWCGPCRLYSPKLENLLLEHPNVALRKVDVVDWKSDLAKQLTKEYKLPALPFTLIFNDKGELIGRVEGNNIEEVKSIVNKER